MRVRRVAERERVGANFDRAADLFPRARTNYPGRLFDRLVEDAEGYTRLLSAFSGHIRMTCDQRDRLLGEIRHPTCDRASA